MVDLPSRVATEIEQLHQFFEAWFRGTASASPATFARLERAFAPKFQIIFASGNRANRNDLLDEMRGHHGSRRAQGDAFAIAIKNVELRWHTEGFVLATYEEWQQAPNGGTARASSVLFTVDPSSPTSLLWLHVHECWLPGHAPA